MGNENETVITLKEVYDLLIDMKIEMSGHPKQIDDHERRLRALELRVWTAGGFFSLAAIVLSQVINLLKG